MHVDPNSPHATLTKRQQEVLDRLSQGMGAREIARDIGVSRNAVYQHIDRLRRQGALAQTYTPSGQPPRSLELGAASFTPAIAPQSSGIAALRDLALAGAARDEAEYARLIEAAIADGDAPALAYELGRMDAGDEAGLPADLVVAALRRLGALAPIDPADE